MKYLKTPKMFFLDVILLDTTVKYLQDRFEQLEMYNNNSNLYNLINLKNGNYQV